MILIRSVEPRDLSDVCRLARQLDSYNLPADRPFLKRLIHISVRSFARSIPVSDRRYLFVAQDSLRARVIGSSLIIGRHGTPQRPHLFFKRFERRHRSRTLGLTVSHPCLQLGWDSQGYTELGGLVVDRRWRGRAEKIGKQLAYIRFLYMSAHARDFRRRLLIEYLPPLHRGNGNLVWEALGKHFIPMSYHRADRLSGTNKEFIRALYPRDVIYCDLLPPSLVPVLGQVSPAASISLAMNRRLGFRPLHQIDPFDGGPHFSARLSQIRLLRHIRLGPWRPANAGVSKRKCVLVMVEDAGRVRAVRVPVETARGALCLDRQSQGLLTLAQRQTVRWARL